MGFLPGIAIVLSLITIMVVVVHSLWQRKALVAMGASALLFALLGIALSMLAAYDWATDTTFAYTWGGLPQAAYDTPFVIAFIFAIGATIAAGRLLYERRMDRAALAPADGFASARFQNK